MAAKTDLQPVFERLKKILAPYEPKMDLAQDSSTMYMLNTRFLLKKNYPLMFAGVRLGKNYVSYHLFSVYTTPGDAQTISPDLKKRMQGKACFNFTAVDERLTTSADPFPAGFIWPGLGDAGDRQFGTA